jgi:hypothetical protein
VFLQMVVQVVVIAVVVRRVVPVHPVVVVQAVVVPVISELQPVCCRADWLLVPVVAVDLSIAVPVQVA